MGVASCNKSTGDMLAACGAEQVKQAAGWTLRKQRQQANGAKSAGKLERLKQASWGYLLAGAAPAAKTARGGGASSKSLASSGDEDEAPRRQPLLAGPPVVLDLQDFADFADFEDGAPRRRQVGRSNCYIWPTALAGAVEVALDEAPQVELLSRRPLEEREERAKHIRPAQSSPVLHESLIAPGGLPPAARPPPVVQAARDGGGGGSLSSLAARRESPGGAEAKRARARDRRKLRAGQLQQRLRRLRRGRPPVACDSDSDSCAGERRAAAAAKGKGPHHAGDAAARMLHNCQRATTIEPPRGAGNCSPWRATSPGARTTRGELRNCAADFDFESDSHSDSDFDGAASIGGRERANLDASDQPAAQPGHSEWSGEEVGRSCKNNGRPARPRDFQPAELDASSALAASFRPAASAGRPPLAPDGSWPRALPDRVCRDARRPSGEQQQQQQAPSSSSSKHAAGASHEQPASMGLAELESAASRLASGLLGACSSSAGSYKVAQQQQRQQLELLESHRRRQRHCKRPCELAEVDQRAACDTVGNRALAEGKRQQAGRPGGGGGRQSSSSTRSRSPVALQRQTNARLARHKLKIQQQRQEQLANLAQRERQQFQRASLRLAAAAGRGRQQPAGGGEQLEIEVLSSSGSSARHSNGARPASGSLNYFKTLLLNALPAALSPPGRRQSRDLPFSEPGASAAARLQAGPRRPSGAHCAISIPSGATLAPQATPSNNAPDRAGPSRDRREPLARSLAQANVVVHRSPIDLAAAVANRASFHGRASGRQASAQRRAPTTTAASTTTTAAATTTTPSGVFEFQFRHLAGQRASADESGARRNRLMGAPMGERRALDAQSSPSPSSSSSAASSTLSLNKPFCKICHLSSSKLGDKLISPCKCSGTLQHIHCGCLLKWLEISNRANERQPMSCELCAHEYTWHKRFNYAQMKLPRCSLKDALLHTTFVLALGLMLFCALAPIFHTTRAADELQLGPRLSASAAPHLGDHQPMLSGGARRAQFKTPGAQTATAGFNGGANGGRLAGDEKFILICAGLFFVAFFIAIYAQTKARDTLYGLIVKFANLNLTYYITEYDHGQQQQQQQPARRTGKSEQGARQARPAALDDNNRDLSRCPAAGTQAPREGAPLHAGAGQAHAASLPPLAGQHQKPLQHHHQKG